MMYGSIYYKQGYLVEVVSSTGAGALPRVVEAAVVHTVVLIASYYDSGSGWMNTHNNQHKIEHAPPMLSPFWSVCLVSGDDLLHEMRRTQTKEAFVLQVLLYFAPGGGEVQGCCTEVC